jgi:thiamine-phosphate pyrophosphorylase
VSDNNPNFLLYESFLDERIAFFQLRLKDISDEEFLDEAYRYQRVCKERGVSFIINDNLFIAQEIQADGIHIGQDDIAFLEVKREFDGIVGLSCHNKKEAIEAFDLGVDYIGFGSIYPTQTKKDAKVVGLNSLQEVTQIKSAPVVAIGGINEQNFKEVLDAGADMVAISSAIIKSSNPNKIIDLIKEAS